MSPWRAVSACRGCRMTRRRRTGGRDCAGRWGGLGRRWPPSRGTSRRSGLLGTRWPGSTGKCIGITCFQLIIKRATASLPYNVLKALNSWTSSYSLLWSRSILTRLQLQLQLQRQLLLCSPQFFAVKQVLRNLTSYFTGACLIHRKVRVFCFVLTVYFT